VAPRALARSIVVFALAATACGPLPDYGSVTVSGAAQPSPGSVILVRGAPDQRYAIRLSWPASVGQRGHLQTDSIDSRTTRLRRDDGTEDVKSVSSRVSAEGTYEVLAVDDGGRATGVQLTIDTFDAGGSERSPLHLSGGVVRVERAHDASNGTVTLDGEPADADFRSALGEIISLALPDAPSDDALFGTPTPMPVGARWPIAAEPARRALSGAIMSVGEGAVSGEMTLASVVDRDGVECLEIVGHMDVNPFDLPSAPDGADVQHAETHVVTHVLVPTVALPRFEDDTTTTSQVSMAIHGKGIVDSTSKLETHSTFDPVDG
jgi:hypothetical protein